MSKYFVKGYVIAEYVREPVLLGISAQAIGTFSMDLVNLAFPHDPVLDALCAEVGVPDGSLMYKATLDAPLGW